MVGDHGVEPCRCANLALSKGYKSSPHTSAIPQNLVPAVELESTTPAYETGDYPLRLRWQIWQGRQDLNPQVSGWSRAVWPLAYAPISKSNKKPAVWRVGDSNLIAD